MREVERERGVQVKLRSGTRADKSNHIALLERSVVWPVQALRQPKYRF